MPKGIEISIQVWIKYFRKKSFLRKMIFYNNKGAMRNLIPYIAYSKRDLEKAVFGSKFSLVLLLVNYIKKIDYQEI